MALEFPQMIVKHRLDFCDSSSRLKGISFIIDSVLVYHQNRWKKKTCLTKKAVPGSSQELEMVHYCGMSHKFQNLVAIVAESLTWLGNTHLTWLVTVHLAWVMSFGWKWGIATWSDLYLKCTTTERKWGMKFENCKELDSPVTKNLRWSLSLSPHTNCWLN